MGTESRFREFLRNIAVTESNIEDALRKTNGVAKKLHSHFYGDTYSNACRMIIGSYGKGTQVRPSRDIDVLFLMPYREFERYDSYAGNGQSALLQKVKNVIQERYPTTDKIRGDGQVVVVPFVGGHSVELLPAWRLDNNRFVIPDTHGGGSWKVVDHGAEIKNVADSDSLSGGDTRSLIRMMKTWQRHCNVPITSLVLELRAVRFLADWDNKGRGPLYYDWMVRDYLKQLIERAGYHHKIPGIEENCEYGDAWLSRAASAYSRAVKACNYEHENKHIDAAYEWRKIFGDKYDF
ncbi:SMODS domain-containing nucleotidyltransferase [Streptomyces griseosporeus]|uniref:SMODS domain-containing nucleotidyltransferase n=1 Tax=Streptomyces griseosporeus TaxID=1910 RepID=UPI0036AD2874